MIERAGRESRKAWRQCRKDKDWQMKQFDILDNDGYV